MEEQDSPAAPLHDKSPTARQDDLCPAVGTGGHGEARGGKEARGSREGWASVARPAGLTPKPRVYHDRNLCATIQNLMRPVALCS